MSEDLQSTKDDDFDPDFLGVNETTSEDVEVENVDWGGGELEQAYLKAMLALEASETEFPEISNDDSDNSAESAPASHSERVSAVSLGTDPAVKSEKTNSAVAEFIAEQAAAELQKSNAETSADVRLMPRQILEACLFVGGTPLASGKLATVLRGDFESDYIDREIDELNRLYAAENRPYEIRLGDGGYRLTLREEYERIRYKVYGLGPKEVRLSQEALEVLAVVAYHQPIRQTGVEELGKPNCGAVLRQLVRRELLAVERDVEHPRDVNYKTTSRFLSLFGIRNLDELPRHEQLGYK